MEAPFSRELLLAQIETPYKSVFERWSDEDVKRYVFLINATSPKDTYERTLRPDILGLATGFHERQEMLEIAHILSEKNNDALYFENKLRNQTLSREDVHGYYTPSGESNPKKIYFAAHRKAYRKEMEFLKDLGKKFNTDLSSASLFATSPRLLNSLGETVIDTSQHQTIYDREKVVQLGQEADHDEYQQFPGQHELYTAYKFWKQFGDPYSSQARSYLELLKA